MGYLNSVFLKDIHSFQWTVLVELEPSTSALNIILYFGFRKYTISIKKNYKSQSSYYPEIFRINISTFCQWLAFLMFIYSFICSFSKYLLDIYYVPGTVLNTEDIVVSTALSFWPYSLMGKMRNPGEYGIRRSWRNWKGTPSGTRL